MWRDLTPAETEAYKELYAQNLAKFHELHPLPVPVKVRPFRVYSKHTFSQ